MTRRPRRRERPTERDIASLADGTLAPERRERVERAVAASADLQAALRDQRIAIAAVRVTAEERAPASLRHALVPMPLGQRAWRGVGASVLAGGAAALAAIALALGGGEVRSPSVADAVGLAGRPPSTGPPPGAHDARFGWRAIGARSDRVNGRTVKTVFYRHGRAVAAYTIVGGSPLAVGSATSIAMRGGTRFQATTVHGRPTVTWVRGGHTCVLSGTHTSRAALLRLAAWRGAGELPL